MAPAPPAPRPRRKGTGVAGRWVLGEIFRALDPVAVVWTLGSLDPVVVLDAQALLVKLFLHAQSLAAWTSWR